jgi:hypothetical protein
LDLEETLYRNGTRNPRIHGPRARATDQSTNDEHTKNSHESRENSRTVHYTVPKDNGIEIESHQSARSRGIGPQGKVSRDLEVYRCHHVQGEHLFDLEISYAL